MATPNQIHANRLNAQKSTGPRSPRGKAASRFNALKSGIDAQSHILPGEDPARLETLVAEYQQRFSTSTPERRMLVDTLVACEWLFRRLNRAEASLWQYKTMSSKSRLSSNEHSEGRVLDFADRIFDRLQRRVDAIHRNYHRALKELQRLDEEDAVECPSDPPDPPADSAPEPAPPPSNQQPESQIGFVPQFPQTSPLPLLQPPAPNLSTGHLHGPFIND
jgi:hypothetical protein